MIKVEEQITEDMDWEDVKKTGQNSSDSDEGKLKENVRQPAHSCQRRSRSHSPRGYSGSGWTYTPLRDVRLPQLYQPLESLSRGLCIPRSDSPVQRWNGFNSEEELMRFL